MEISGILFVNISLLTSGAVGKAKFMWSSSGNPAAFFNSPNGLCIVFAGHYADTTAYLFAIASRYNSGTPAFNVISANNMSIYANAAGTIDVKRLSNPSSDGVWILGQMLAL